MHHRNALPNWVNTHVHLENTAEGLDFPWLELGCFCRVKNYCWISSWKPYFTRVVAGFKKLLSSRQRGVLPRMSWSGWKFERS